MDHVHERSGRRTHGRKNMMKHRDVERVTLKRAGPNTEQLKEESLPWRQRGRPAMGFKN